jgi:hypothetical protein
MQTFNADRSFFNVICLYRSGLALGTDQLLDRAEVIDWIATGQFTDIVRIVELNPAEGWSRDVTGDVMADANIAREAKGYPMLEVA